MVDGQFPLFPLQHPDLRMIQFDRAVHPVNEVSMVKTDRMYVVRNWPQESIIVHQRTMYIISPQQLTHALHIHILNIHSRPWIQWEVTWEYLQIMLWLLHINCSLWFIVLSNHWNTMLLQTQVFQQKGTTQLRSSGGVTSLDNYLWTHQTNRYIHCTTRNHSSNSDNRCSN